VNTSRSTNSDYSRWTSETGCTIATRMITSINREGWSSSETALHSILHCSKRCDYDTDTNKFAVLNSRLIYIKKHAPTLVLPCVAMLSSCVCVVSRQLKCHTIVFWCQRSHQNSNRTQNNRSIEIDRFNYIVRKIQFNKITKITFHSPPVPSLGALGTPGPPHDRLTTSTTTSMHHLLIAIA